GSTRGDDALAHVRGGRPKKTGARPGGRTPWSEGSPHGRAGSPVRTDYGRFCADPWRATAPGPGRSAAESTKELKVSGMQKMLTSLAGLAAPPVVRAPAAAPVSEMVRATSSAVNAPEVRWPQLTKPLTVEQSAFDVQAIGRHGEATEHGEPVVPVPRSEEHTSELQSPDHLVCRLLLEKKKRKRNTQ